MHLIMDFHSPNIGLMTDRKAMSEWIKELARVAGMTPLSEPVVEGFPWPGSHDANALSAVCFLRELAIVVHTYPEKQFVFLDIFSCRDFDTNHVMGNVSRAFEASKPTVVLLDRGVSARTGQITPVRLHRGGNPDGGQNPEGDDSGDT